MKLLRKLHEALADRFSFIQYPDIRPADQRTRTASRSSSGFDQQMSLGKRFDLIMMSIALLIAGMIGLLIVAFMVYVVLF